MEKKTLARTQETEFFQLLGAKFDDNCPRKNTCVSGGTKETNKGQH